MWPGVMLSFALYSTIADKITKNIVLATFLPHQSSLKQFARPGSFMHLISLEKLAAIQSDTQGSWPLLTAALSFA